MLEIKIFLGGRRMEESMIDTKKKPKKDKEDIGAVSWEPNDKNSSRRGELIMSSTKKRSRRQEDVDQDASIIYHYLPNFGENVQENKRTGITF